MSLDVMSFSDEVAASHTPSTTRSASHHSFLSSAQFA